jgi:hypothetical protein
MSVDRSGVLGTDAVDNPRDERWVATAMGAGSRCGTTTRPPTPRTQTRVEFHPCAVDQLRDGVDDPAVPVLACARFPTIHRPNYYCCCDVQPDQLQ